jgi:DNA helicase-2/ATP-dependent DNA helicase PcrA
MSEWSSYQEAIFRNIAEGKGHTVVKARAGSGKTTTIMEGLKHVPPKKTVLMVAFNKKIAEELSSRAPNGVEVATLHSYGLRQVKGAFGNVKIETRKMDGFIRARIGEGPGAFEIKRALCKTIGLAKATLVGLTFEDGGNKPVEDQDKEYGQAVEDIDRIIDSFGIDTGMEESKRYEFVQHVIALMRDSFNQKDVLDFDDMVWFPVVHNLKQWQYDRVFIDETQDLNAAQVELALRACKSNGRILAVGDERQAIYGFRGADEGAVDNVIHRLKAKEMKLTVCYRCASSIVELAQKTVPDFEPSPRAVVGLVVGGVNEKTMREKVGPGDFILSRANAPLVSLCWSFIKEGRPATIQGRDFASALTGMIAKARKATIMKPEGKVKVTSVEDFLEWLDEWRTIETTRLRQKDRDTQAVDDKAECLEALCDGCRSLDEVVAKCEQLFGDADDDTKRIVLSSTHKAKGLERDRVFVLADTYRKKRPKMTPSQSLEEDNLWYVAVTRARAELYLVIGIGGGSKKSSK